MNDIVPPALTEPEGDPFLLAADAPPPAPQAFPAPLAVLRVPAEEGVCSAVRATSRIFGATGRLETYAAPVRTAVLSWSGRVGLTMSSCRTPAAAMATASTLQMARLCWQNVTYRARALRRVRLRAGGAPGSIVCIVARSPSHPSHLKSHWQQMSQYEQECTQAECANYNRGIK